MQRLDLYRTVSALILSFVIQGCVAAGPVTPLDGSPPPATPFDAYDVCAHNLPPLPPWEVEAGLQNCFKQTIQVNHLALPAGVTAEQVYAKYKGCLNQNGHTVSIGPFALGGYKADTRRYCFTSALK